jgi:hypothetical protein
VRVLQHLADTRRRAAPNWVGLLSETGTNPTQFARAPAAAGAKVL